MYITHVFFFVGVHLNQSVVTVEGLLHRPTGVKAQEPEPSLKLKSFSVTFIYRGGHQCYREQPQRSTQKETAAGKHVTTERRNNHRYKQKEHKKHQRDTK